MTFPGPVVAGMAGVTAAIVDHFQPQGPERRCQLVAYGLSDGSHIDLRNCQFFKYTKSDPTLTP